MPTPITRHVNTASAGGDGTTTALSGANAAYVSLNAAFDAEQKDIVAADEEWTFLCAGGADTVAPSLSSTWVMDSTHRVIVRPEVGQEHGGSYNTSVYRIELTTGGSAIGAGSGTVIHHVIYEGIQFKFTFSGVSGARYCFDFTTLPANFRYNLASCLVKFVNGGTYTGNAAAFCRNNDGDTQIYLNSIIIDCAGLGTLTNGTCNTARVYNCTIVNAITGISSAGATYFVRNNLFYNCTTDVSGSVNAASDYNMSNNATAPPGTHSLGSRTFQFVNAGAGDYHLAASDTGAKDAGEDLTGVTGLYTNKDIDGVARSGTWDVGADEFVPSGGVSRTDMTIRIVA